MNYKNKYLLRVMCLSSLSLNTVSITDVLIGKLECQLMDGKSPIPKSFIKSLKGQIALVSHVKKRAQLYREMLDIRGAEEFNTCFQKLLNDFYPGHTEEKRETSSIYDQLKFLYWELFPRFICDDNECGCLVSVENVDKEFKKIHELNGENIIRENKELELSGEIENMIAALRNGHDANTATPNDPQEIQADKETAKKKAGEIIKKELETNKRFQEVNQMLNDSPSSSSSSHSSSNHSSSGGNPPSSSSSNHSSSNLLSNHTGSPENPKNHSANNATSNKKNGMSTEKKVLIGGGVVLVSVIAIGALYYFVIKDNKKKQTKKTTI